MQAMSFQIPTLKHLYAVIPTLGQLYAMTPTMGQLHADSFLHNNCATSWLEKGYIYIYIYLFIFNVSEFTYRGEDLSSPSCPVYHTNHSRGLKSNTANRAPQRAISNGFTPSVCMLFHGVSRKPSWSLIYRCCCNMSALLFFYCSSFSVLLFMTCAVCVHVLPILLDWQCYIV